MPTGRSSIAALIAIVLVGSVGVPNAGAIGQADKAPAQPRNTALLGEVLSDGAPLGGAHVAVDLWPSAASLRQLRVGKAVPMLHLPEVTTDPSGRYAVVIDPLAVPASYVGDGGAVSLEITASTSSRQLVWHTSIVPNSSGSTLAWRTPKAAPGSSAPAELTMDLARTSGAALSTDLPSRWVQLPGRVGPALTAAGLEPARTAPVLDSSSQPPSRATRKTCVTLKTSTLYTNNDEIFMAAYAWTGAMATVSQGASSSHILGIAAADGAGPYSASGSSTFTETQGSSVTQTGVADAYVHNAVNYRKYQRLCTGHLVHYTLVAESTYDYLSDFTYARHVSYTANCVTKMAGATVIKNTGTDITYAAGLSLPVVSLSAQSGWSTTTEATWHVTARTLVCGDDPRGWPSSSSVSLSAG